MVYLEPAPYVVGFVEQARGDWSGRIDVAYIDTIGSQPWEHQIRPEQEFVLPNGLGAAVGEIRRRLASGRYALVHLAGWGHPVLLIALLLAKFYRLRVTVESDTPRPAEQSFLKRAIKRLVYPWLFSLPDLFLPGGRRQAAYLRSYGVDEGRIHIAQMTVDIEQLRSRIQGQKQTLRERFRKRFDICKDAACALYMGRLEYYKGVEDLLESYRTISQSSRSAVLLIVGDGSLRDAVRVAQSECRSIRYAGRLSGDEVLEAYCAADFLVLPSRSESWGLVVNEAMAVGLPVIVSDRVGCIDDLVRNQVTGLVVPAKSPSALAAAIKRLNEDSELRAAIGSKGTELISRWTLGNQADRTTRAWRCALGVAIENVYPSVS
jgi:glycosyltransferase involved in cell wall biosynthesis